MAYYVTVLTGVALFTIQALGLDIQWGWAGMLNLSYIAWVALGAYVLGFVTFPRSSNPTIESYWLGLHLPYLVGVAAAIVVCAVCSFGVGWIALRRLRTDYFAIATLGIYTMFASWANAYVPFANGSSGLYNYPQPWSSVIATQDYNLFFLLLSVIALVVVFLLVWRVQRSPYGRTLRAIREDQLAAQAFGRDVFWFKLRAFVLGSSIAGLGGALLATYVNAWGPSSWTASETLILLTAVMVGGTGNNWGVLLGAVLVNGLFTALVAYIPDLPGRPDFLQNARLVVYGVLILLVLYFRPQGAIPERRDKDKGDVTAIAHGAEPSPSELAVER